TYVVDHYEMEVYDISTPDDPVFVTGGPVTHGASECLVAYMTEPTGPGNYLYGANGSSLFVVQVDLTTGTPVLTDVTSIPTEAYDLAVAGSYLYVARDDVRFMSFPDGVAVYDLATPASPALLAQWDVDGGACAVETKDTHVYVVSPYADAKIYDATDPANPLLAASYPGSYGYALLANDILYAVNFAGVDVLDVADPTDPRLLQRYALGLDMLGQHLVFRDGYLFTAGNNVAVINDSAAVFSPITAGLVSLPHSANLVVAAGEYAYVSGTHLSVVAIGDPTAPTVLGTCDLPITPISMLAHGDIVATVGQDYQLTLVDVSDRSAPTALTTLSGPYYGVSAAGDCLLATADSGIVTLDITEPGSPVPIAIFSEAGGAASLHPMGQSVVAAGVTGISVVGAINPKNLTLEQSCSCDAFCGLDVTGSLVYMARMAPTFSLGVYDTQGETPGTPFGVFEKWVVDTDAVGNLAFVTDVSWSGDHMLYAVYASSGESLRLKDSWSFPYISGIDAAGGYLYAGFSTVPSES
ncbi:MAG: hypothetical protein KAU31_00440, partial [Spirochaetaceae bacterium]|nr:hypothetical protein [Spirochaetaceae bacterium]